ncbi:hypothetical protein [Pseudomonas oryzihabitans]|uniref:hypothetical protein n=1 Tax=Pseudomonas oryzihabitans TaxID=47885 RepID=UPI00289C6A8D|nr:hypothetical protein [Pseudomonas oryzihabitans]
MNQQLITALRDCVSVMERELNGLAVIQPELRQAREALELMERTESPLRDALSHIAKVCAQSREQSRRIRWIMQRADWALTGRKYDAGAFDLPRSAGDTAASAKVRMQAMKAERDAAQASLQVAVAALRRLETEPGCGCSPPCRCSGPEWSRAEIEGRMGEAEAALRRIEQIQGGAA